MNNNLDKIRVIESEKLNSEIYFQSLLEEAHYKGLLSAGDIERLQFECLNLLAYKTERYNAGDSTSIQVEKAQSIMTSILFTIGIWLKTYQNPDDAVAALQNETIDGLYQKGRKRIDTMIAATKTIHLKLTSQLVETPNVFYRSTLVDGIYGFFKLYDADYAAQEIHITADYPLYNPTQRLAGIEFISAYVKAAYYENLFCSYFAPDDIHHLLCGYAEDYQKLLINIYEPVLTVALGCHITSVDIHQLDVTENGKAYLEGLFAQMKNDEILITVQKATDELNRLLGFSHELIQYIRNSLPLITTSIKIAAEQNTLDRVFFTPAFPENKPKLIFSFGDKMEDEQYRKIIEEIGQCRFLQDKVAIIKEHIHSLADLEDVLLDAELTSEEIRIIISKLNLPEIAALSKKYLSKSNIDMVDLREAEQALTKSLYDFISTLPPEQQELIAQASKAIQEE